MRLVGLLLVLLLRYRLVAFVVRRAAAAALPSAEHFHFAADDVVSGALDAVFAGVFAALDAAFNVNLAAFFQVLSRHFGQAAVEGDVVPFGAFLTLSGLSVVPCFAGGDGKVADGLAVGHVAHFGVAAEVADKDDFV
ncbi:hypothetical protein NEIELOOT_00156 [Neisseria elongata subsp. glycolytica ATCC 29315]|uniref:Uncharacterized protein n=1 Tax=Neisseria elongata subsp. glycolytica ATCC 29315 TaxID=546263 RepID=D4DM91_NEIEG|nr:hypothetical protein NEIELOOT_00156 [Neisseria elongata subsp. glycolytica ATCC 29315]